MTRGAVALALTGCLFALALCLAPGVARAHGREPVVGAVAFDPSDDQHIVLRATWALLESADGGGTWRWRCADAVGFERTTEDPPVVIASDHRILAGLFNGLTRSEPLGCSYTASEATEVYRLYVIDMIADPVDPHVVWAITSPGDRANTVIRSADDGVTWEVLSSPDPMVLLERIRVAPSDPSRVYVSGVVPRRTDTPRRTLFFASSDGGRTFTTTEIPLEGEERNVHVLAVDPTNPDRVLVRMVRLVTDEVPERLLLSEDGGRTFVTAASLLEITGCVFSPDGSQAWVGGWDGAFLRSDAAGAAGTFVPVAGNEMLRVRCLANRPGDGTRPDELWICTDDLRGDFALGRSTDGGASIERVWGFSDATSDTGCECTTPVGSVCPGFWPDVIFDLGLEMDAGLDADGGSIRACGPDAPLDAGTGGMDAGPGAGPAGCGCSVHRGGGAWTLVLLAALAARRLRVRR